MKNKPITILAISGSLRNTSSNSYIIKAIAQMLPADVEYIIYDGLAGIPHFDDAAEIPHAVTEWREQVIAADGILFCSPEYAFGVPGTLKNALDWAVGSIAFSDKPVALITAALGGDRAHAALLNVLTALGTNISSDLLISFVRKKLSEKGDIIDEATLTNVRQLVTKLIESVKNLDDSLA